jgi:nucleoside-diphosphate-sugar epimerase
MKDPWIIYFCVHQQLGALNMLEYCARRKACKKFVLASTQQLCTETSGRPARESAPRDIL